MTEKESTSLEKLELRYKELNKHINELDYILYGEGYKDFISGESDKWQSESIQELSDLRYSYAVERGKICDKIRKLKLSKYNYVNKRVMSFGCFNDLHTPKPTPSAKNHLSAIRGISL